MTPKEEGYILLTSHLGDPSRPVLTPHMMQTLFDESKQLRTEDPDRMITTKDLELMHIKRDLAERVIYLMSQKQQLHDYVSKGADRGCFPVTPISRDYPQLMLGRRGRLSPGCLWVKGNKDIINMPGIASVGSRKLDGDGRYFSRIVGEEAGKQNFVLISGNAYGSDMIAEISAIDKNGCVVSVLATRLDVRIEDPLWVYMSEYDYDMDFSAQRALSRNHTIHSMGLMTLVTKCTEGSGGTWQGTMENMKNRWNPIACDRLGGPGNYALAAMGATLITERELYDLKGLCNSMWATFKK